MPIKPHNYNTHILIDFHKICVIIPKRKIHYSLLKMSHVDIYEYKEFWYVSGSSLRE